MVTPAPPRGRISLASGRRVFGNQVGHPAEFIKYGGSGYSWQSWWDWLEDFNEEPNYSKKRLMLKWGIIYGFHGEESQVTSFEAFAFYLAMSDRQDRDQRGGFGLGTPGWHQFHGDAFEVLFGELAREGSLYAEACEKDIRFIAALLDFFCCWPTHMVLNANLPHGGLSTQERECNERVRAWAKAWAGRVWSSQQALFVDEDLRHHMLALVVHLKCIKLCGRDRGLYQLTAEDAVWLRENMLRDREDVLLARGGQTVDEYAANVIALAESIHRAKESVAKDPPKY